MKRSVSLFLIFILLCSSLCGCGKDKVKIPEKVTYYDNLSVVGLAINAEEELTNPTVFVDISADVLEGAGGIRIDFCQAYVAKKADDGRLDEYGIFHAKNDDSLEGVYKSVSDYVNSRKNDGVTLSHYEDAETVRNGVVKCYGNYVVYTFLSDNGNTQFHSLVESLLQE